MSINQIIAVNCPKCGKESDVVVWTSLNVNIDPDAKEGLLQGKINVFHCSHCDFEDYIDVKLLYHDMRNMFCVQYYPFNSIEEERFLDTFNENAQPELDTPNVPIPEYFKNVHIVFSMSELVRYVLFRDSLAGRKESVKSGTMACFCCGGNMKKGEHYYCAARRRHIKGDKDESSDLIKDASSSLQVCTRCLEKAAGEKIELSNSVIPLLNLEIAELYKFAKRSVDNKKDSEEQDKSRDSCSLCTADIRVGDQYTRLTMGEEVEDGDSVRTISEYTFAVLCKNCADKYMAWT